MKSILTVHGPGPHRNGFAPAHPENRPAPIKAIEFTEGFLGISSFHERHEATQTAGFVTPRGHVISWTDGGVAPWPHDFYLPSGLTSFGAWRKGKAHRSNRTYAGEEVAKRLFRDMRREVCYEDVCSLVCRKMSADVFQEMGLKI